LFFEFTAQGYYKQLRQGSKEQLQEGLIIELVQQVRRTNKKMGGKKLYYLLAEQIHKIAPGMGRDKFFDLLGRWELLVKRRRKYAVTTQSRHRFYKYPNKLQSFKATQPHQAWVCDITYVRMAKNFAYLFLITDAYSRKIIGWELSDNLGLTGAIKSMGQAIRQCPDCTGLIHHSDRGLHYCSNVYVKKLKSRHIEISMAEAGNCYENAMAERVNGILKQEYGLDETFANLQQARQATKEGINAYNEERPHWSLNLQIPSRVHERYKAGSRLPCSVGEPSPASCIGLINE
jgi:transposase InsO family protein